MKTSWAISLCTACFCLGLGTGALWMQARQVTLVNEPGELKSTRQTKVSDRPRQVESTSVDAARAGGKLGHDKNREAAERQKGLADRAKPLIDAALQLRDDSLRAGAIGDIRKALGSTDRDDVAVGLLAFNGLYELEFDKASFRNLIVPHLEDSDEGVRANAWSALMMAGLQDGDAAHMREVAKKSGMGPRTSHLLFRMEKGDLTGDSGEIVQGLLDRTDVGKSREVMRGTWGANFSPALEADIISLSRDPAFLHDAVYFSLSTQRNKSAATVARLLEVLEDPDSVNNGGRAAWGLGYGISPEATPGVAAAAAKIVSTRSSGYMLEQAWSLLERYAGPAELPLMQDMEKNPSLPEDRRNRIKAIITRLSLPGS